MPKVQEEKPYFQRVGIQTGKTGWAYITEAHEYLDSEYKTDQARVGKPLPF